MRTRRSLHWRLLAIFFCVAAAAAIAGLDAQAPAPPPTTAPQPPRPAAAPRRPVTMTITVAVTDGTGAAIKGARVAATGPVNRDGQTIADGTIRLTGMKGGAYRIRVEHPAYVTLERDVVVKTAQTPIEIVLTEAPPAPEPEPTVTPPAQSQANTPPGEPRRLNVTDFLEKNFIGGKEPFRQDEMGCTASARTTLIQVLEPTKEEANQSADEVLFAVAGEGTLRLGNADVAFSSKQGSVAIVPRGTVRALSRKGRSPLIVLSVVSGPSCTK